MNGNYSNNNYNSSNPIKSSNNNNNNEISNDFYNMKYNYNEFSNNNNYNPNNNSSIFKKSNTKDNLYNSIHKNFLGVSVPINSNMTSPIVKMGSPSINVHDNIKSEINKKSIDKVKQNYENYNKGNFYNSVIKNRGKTVLGIQPLQDYTNADSIKRDNVNKRKFDEINESLDIFRTEMTNTLRKINKQQARLRVDKVLDEMYSFKNEFIDSLARSERKKEEENEYMLKEIKKLKNEIQKNYDENISNYKMIRNFQDDIFEFEKDINLRINRMEKNQNDQFDKLYALIMNMNLDNNNNKDDKIDMENEDDDRLKDEDEIDKLKRKRNINKAIDENINQNLTNRSKIKTTNFKDNYVLKKQIETSKKMPLINKKIASAKETIDSNNNDEANISNYQKLKRYFYIANFCSRIIADSRESNYAVKFDSLKYFIDNSRTSTYIIEEWIRSIVESTLNNLRTSEGLEIDMTEMSTSHEEAQDTFIKLKTRVEGLINPLISNLNTINPNLDLTTLTWLRLSISNNRIVPFSFYYNFVLSRIRTNNGELYSIENKHIFIILSFFVFIHIIVIKILVSEMKNYNSNNNANASLIRKNFKMIASVIYHSYLRFYGEKMKIISQIKNYSDCVKNQFEGNLNINVVFSKNSTIYYRSALKNFYSKQEYYLNNKRNESKVLTNKMIDEFHNIIKDNNPNEVNELSSVLYSSSQMQTYFKMASSNQFDIMSSVNTFTQNLINKILTYKVNVKDLDK